MLVFQKSYYDDVILMNHVFFWLHCIYKRRWFGFLNIDLKLNYSFDALELDYDMDEEEVKKYSPGEVLPVFLFYSDNEELGRLTGEVSFDELEKKYLEVNQ